MKLTAKRKKTIVIAAAVLAAILIALLSWMSVELVKFKGAPSREFWSADATFDISKDVITIEASPDKDFKILNIADLQLNDLIEGKENAHALNTMDAIVAQESPDLITLTGDIVWASPFTRESIKKLISRLDGYKIPWAPVFGNHDENGNNDLNWFADRILESNYALFRKGPNNIGGVGNYIINIKQNDKIIQTLFMMDSHNSRQYTKTDESGKTYQESDEDYIYYSQQAWYKWAVNGITAANGNKVVSSTVMMHIPLPEFADAYAEYGYDEKTGVAAHPEMGFGYNGEDVCCAPVNSGFFALIKEMGSTKNVVACHDHVNNSSLLYNGVRLTYAMKTGATCYYDEKRNGGTVLSVDSDMRVTTSHVYVSIAV